MPDLLESCITALQLPSQAVDSLRTYLEEIQRHQKRYGLIRASRSDLIGHLVESLLALEVIDLTGVIDLLDLGSGVGLPGVVFGIAAKYRYPQLRLTLVERRTKRALFLEGVIARLGLDNTRVFSDDARRIAAPADAAVCRAFMPLGKQLIALAKEILKPEGWLAYFAGQRSLIDEEELGANETRWSRLPIQDKERWVCVVKVSPTT